MKKSILAVSLLISATTHTSVTRQTSLQKDEHRYTRHHGAMNMINNKFEQSLEAARNKGNKSPQSITTDFQATPQRYIPGLPPKSPVNMINGLHKNKSFKK